MIVVCRSVGTIWPWLCSAFISGAPQREVYFMGLIDVLTQYDTKKKAAHAAKTVKHGVSNTREKEEGKRWRAAVRLLKTLARTCSARRCLLSCRELCDVTRTMSLTSLSLCCRLALKSPRSTPSSTPKGFATSSPTFLRNTTKHCQRVDPTESWQSILPLTKNSMHPQIIVLNAIWGETT